jgi:hypothetical protein
VIGTHSLSNVAPRLWVIGTQSPSNVASRLWVIGTQSPSNVAPHPRKETPDFDVQIIRVYHGLQEETTADRPFRCL